MDESPSNAPPAVRPLVPPEERVVGGGHEARETRGAILPTPTSDPVPLIGMAMSSSAAISPRGPQGGGVGGPGGNQSGMTKPNIPATSSAPSHYAKNVPPRFQKQGGPGGVPSSSAHDVSNNQPPPPLSSFGVTPPSLSPGNNVNAASNVAPPRDERESNYGTYPGRGHPHHPHSQQHQHHTHGLPQQQGGFHGGYHGGPHGSGSSPIYQPVSPEPLEAYSAGDRDHYREYEQTPPVEKPLPPRQQAQQQKHEQEPEIGEWRGTTGNNTIVGLMDNQQMKR